jgi:hypothetical protein
MSLLYLKHRVKGKVSVKTWVVIIEDLLPWMSWWDWWYDKWLWVGKTELIGMESGWEMNVNCVKALAANLSENLLWSIPQQGCIEVVFTNIRATISFRWTSIFFAFLSEMRYLYEGVDLFCLRIYLVIWCFFGSETGSSSQFIPAVRITFWSQPPSAKAEGLGSKDPRGRGSKW